MSKWNFEKLTNDLNGKTIRGIQISNDDEMVIFIGNNLALEVKLTDKNYLNENFDIN